MSAKKIELQDLRLDLRYNKLKEISKKEFIKLKEFIELNKNGEGSSGVDISEKTERKYIDAFAMVYKALKGKELLKLTKEDLTELKKKLKEGKIKSKFKRAYSLASVRDMQIILMRFLEHNKPEKYSPMRKWFILTVPKKDVEYLTEEEIEKLFRACKTNAERYLIAVLFDSGARASEFINIRFEDWEEPTQQFPYYKVRLKEEYSKTKGRSIGLYWKHSTDAVRDYLAELDNSDLKEPVYQKTYDSIRIFLTRMGKRVLEKRTHFHKFRKSSASYYATKLKSRQQLCYRYGWSFSSSVPDVYISRNQGEEEVKNEMVNTSMQKLEKQNQELETKMALMSEQMGKDIQELQSGYDEVMKEKLDEMFKDMEKHPEDWKPGQVHGMPVKYKVTKS